MTASARTAEHDAFGPWIDTVRTSAEVPRLFRPHGVDPSAARLVLKVPRDIPRRDTDPSMDLYEHLLIVGEDDLEVLSRAGSAFSVRSIPFSDIVAVRDGVDLLDGRLALHSSDGEVVRIRYNGASSEVVVELTELLIRLASSAGGRIAQPAAWSSRIEPRVDLGEEETGIASAYWELAARSADLRYLSSSRRVPLVPTATGVRGILQRLRPLSLAGGVAACTPRELLILTRREPVLRRRSATLSIDRLHILRHAISSTTSEPHPRWAGMSTVTIHAGAAAFPIVAATTDAMESHLLTVAG